MESNESNLYEFYRLIGKGNYASLTEYDEFSVVSGKMGAWPQMIFDFGKGVHLVNQLNKAFSMTGSTFSGNAVSNRSNFIENDQELLRQYGIFPVGLWPMMEMNIESKPTGESVDLDYRKLSIPSEIGAFTEMVNEGFLKKQKVEIDLFQELVSYDEIEFHGLFYNSRLVSGLLSYADKYNVTGLYFITTLSGCRGKGFATALITRVVRELFQTGSNKIVLQAFSQAIVLYTKLGFSITGELLVFFKQ